MVRSSAVLLAAVCLLSTACDAGPDAARAQQPLALAQAEAQRHEVHEAREPKSRFILALAGVLDAVENVEDQDRDQVRGMLLEQDERLHQLLDGDLAAPILRAQGKLPRHHAAHGAAGQLYLRTSESDRAVPHLELRTSDGLGAVRANAAPEELPPVPSSSSLTPSGR